MLETGNFLYEANKIIEMNARITYIILSNSRRNLSNLTICK
jgi:hypothetical protein